MAGASTLRALWSVTLRMGTPALCALALLFFARAFESFEVPALVGLAGNINVLTTTIFQAVHRTGMPSYGEAGAYSVCLVVVVAMLLFWQNRLSRNAHRYQTITGKGFRPHILDLGPWRYAGAAILLALFLVVTVVPVAILIFTSFQPFYGGLSIEAFGRSSLDNYRVLLGPGSFRDSIANTLILGAATASFVVPFTALCGWLVARRVPGAALQHAQRHDCCIGFVLPVNRLRAIDFIQREADAARRKQLNARLLNGIGSAKVLGPDDEKSVAGGLLDRRGARRARAPSLAEPDQL